MKYRPPQSTYTKLTSDLPAQDGVYMVWNGDQALYVGQTSNLYRRFIGHHLRKEFIRLGITHITWMRLHSRNSKCAIERALILALRPQLNLSAPRSKDGPQIFFYGRKKAAK